MKTKLNLSVDVEVALAAKRSGMCMSNVAERAIRAELDLPDSEERAQAIKKNPDKIYVKDIGWVLK